MKVRPPPISASTALLSRRLFRIFDGEIVYWPDERHHYGEERWIAVGIAQGQEVIVVYVEEDEEVRRIVSARPATRHERALYWRTVGQQD